MDKNNFIDDENNIIDDNNKTQMMPSDNEITSGNSKQGSNNNGNNQGNNGSDDGKSPKSSKFNNTLRLLFLFSFGAPAIFFLLQKNHQKILWRKIDNENLKTLQIILSLINPGFDRDYLLKVHVTKHHDASQIISVSDGEVIEFIHGQSIFQKNNKFSSDLYKNFIKKHDLIETHLINTMKEIVIIKKYENLNYKQKQPSAAMEIINPIMNNYLVDFLTKFSKEIKYSLFFFKKDAIPHGVFSIKQQQEAYDHLKSRRNSVVFSQKKFHGLVIKIPINKYPITITPQEIKDYYETHDKIYQQEENLHTFIIFARDKKELESTVANFYNRQLSLRDIEGAMETQQKVFNSLSDKEFPNFKNLFNQQGLNNFIINPMNGQGFVAVAVIKQEIKSVPLEKATPFIEKKIRHQKLLKVINEEMVNIKEKPEYIKKHVAINYIIKNKEDAYYKLRKNQFEIANNEIIIFIQQRVENKKLLTFTEAQESVITYLNRKYQKKTSKEIFDSNLAKLKQKKSIDNTFFQTKEGLIGLYNLLEKQKLAHIVLSNLRNGAFIRKEAIVINNLTFNHQSNLINPSLIKEFLSMVNEKELAIQLNSKIGYCHSMSKYENKILVTIKDFFDILFN
jgi:hypothetical protein